MDINWYQTYRVILNNKPTGYKPNKKALKALTMYLPNCKIHGFGHYGFLNYWYLIVEDTSFPFNFNPGVSNLSWHQATTTLPPKMSQGSQPPEMPPDIPPTG